MTKDKSEEEIFKEHGVLGVRFSDELNRAKNGDKIAAREALKQIAFLLSASNAHSVTGKRWPVPDSVRDYLAEALTSMLEGKTGDQAFHFKKAGRKAWAHFDKRLAADQVFQLVAQGVPVDKATHAAADYVSQLVKKNPCPIAWESFKGRSISGETLHDWYYELKDELEEIHRQSEDL